MIYEVSGDIILTKAQAIAHGVSPNDHFDSGLALILREQWPAMYKDFRHFSHTAHPKPGGAWTWGGVGARRIINLFTQEPAATHNAHPGKATLAHVNHALRELHHVIDKEKITSIALPRLATGVGGLAWDEVLPLIKTHLGGVNIPIFVYSTYRKGVAAAEKFDTDSTAKRTFAMS